MGWEAVRYSRIRSGVKDAQRDIANFHITPRLCDALSDLYMDVYGVSLASVAYSKVLRKARDKALAVKKKVLAEKKRALAGAIQQRIDGDMDGENLV